MTLHLKVLNGEEQKIITDLIALCGAENVKLDYYKVFIDIHIDTSFDSNYLALFSEAHYGCEDYRLSVYEKANHDNDVSIPLKFIDCIYSL